MNNKTTYDHEKPIGKSGYGLWELAVGLATSEATTKILLRLFPNKGGFSTPSQTAYTLIFFSGSITTGIGASMLLNKFRNKNQVNHHAINFPDNNYNR